MRRVAVTGLGVVSPIGSDRETFFAALAKGQGGLRPLTRVATQPDEVSWGGEVLDPLALVEKVLADYQDVPPPTSRPLALTLKRDLKITFALAATLEALADSAVARLDQACLINLGVSLELFALEDLNSIKVAGGPEAMAMRLGTVSLRTPLDRAVTLIEARYGRCGLALANCSACAAGLAALGQAFRSVATGRFELAVAGATDSMINPLGLTGFHLLGALATGGPQEPWSLCRPFDAERTGLVMGEGAAVMVLEPLEKAKAEGKKIYGEILGYGASLDAYGLSAPDPTGSGAERAMRAALSSANLAPEAIQHVNTHGTGTRLNDPIEAAAIRRVLPHWEKVPVAALKSLTGHTIAAAGALEAAGCLFTLAHKLIPPNIGLNKVGLDCELNHVVDKAEKFEGSLIMTNSFGFGGQNAALIFRGI